MPKVGGEELERARLEEVCGVVEALLGVSADADRSFLALGGDSLQAMQVIARVRRRSGVAIEPELLLSGAPLGDVVAAAATSPTRETRTAAPVPPDTRSRASRGQHLVWFVEQLAGSVGAYNVATALHFRGALDQEALQQSVRDAVAAHESLRTVFLSDGDDLLRVVLPPHALDFATVDVRWVPPDERAASFERLVREHASRPFALDAGPVLRATLVAREPDVHTLLLVVPHTAADAWAIGLLARELVERYRAHVAGRPPAVEPPPVDYGAFVAWEAETAAANAGADLAWWTRELEGARLAIELPTALPRPVTQSFEGSRVRFALGAPEAIRDAARSFGVTPFSLLLAAFAVTVSRYTGHRDFLVGIPVAGRDDAAFQDLVGFCAKTLPIRVEIDDDVTVAELARRVHEHVTAALAHSTVALDELVAAANVPRDPARNPLVQLVFAKHDELVERELGDETLSVTVEDVDAGVSPFDATLFVEQFEPEVTGSLEYARAVLSPAEASRFVASYAHVVESVVASPDEPVAAVSAVSPAQRRELAKLNDRPRRHRDATVPELFERQARATPDAEAIVDEDRRLTYGELAEAVEGYAAGLADRGVSPGDYVVVSLDRSAELVAVLAAVLAAGAAYVALELDVPAARRERILTRVAPALVVAAESAESRFEGSAVVTPAQLLRAGVGSRPGRAPVTPESVAYVSFTSGSTGEPKGVCVPHRGIVRLVDGATFASFDAGRRVLQFAPVPFDASTWEIWGTLLNGATLHVFPPTIPAPAELGRFLVEHEITSLWLTSAWFQLLVDHDIESFAGVQEVLTGGDVVSAHHVKELLQAYPGIRVVNGYGPTENTTFTTTYGVTDPDEVGATLPIGSPVEGTTVYVVDDSRRLVPWGAEGELYAGGDGLAVGYLGDPEQTAERFVEGIDGAAERLYRTGDRVRLDAAGRLHFLGRRDDQVKVRGHRIELEEIRQAIFAAALVRDAAVVVAGSGSLDKHLAAFVVPAKDGFDLGATRSALADVLPAYMQPSVWFEVERIPMTRNGKVDRRTLLEELGRRAPARAVDPSTENGTLATVRAALESVLDHADFSDDDDFFEIGGTSLRAARLVAILRKESDVDLPLRAIFESPTAAGLAVRIDAERSSARAS